MNTLYYGDNLDILRRYIKDETVDLVYLDPPFKSNQDYNVLFAEKREVARTALSGPRFLIAKSKEKPRTQNRGPRYPRLDAFGDKVQFEIKGEPVSLPDAEKLAREEPYQFQAWALGLIGARPAELKKGADKGIDGHLYFHDEPKSTKQVVISVKGGHPMVTHVRDLRGVIEREKAAIGVLISMQEPTHPMRAEAASAGFYEAPWGRKYARLQLVTVAGLLAGKTIDFPRENVTFKKAPKAEAPTPETEPLPF